MWSRRLEAKLEGALSTLVDAAQHAPRLFGVAPAHVSFQFPIESERRGFARGVRVYEHGLVVHHNIVSA